MTPARSSRMPCATSHSSCSCAPPTIPTYHTIHDPARLLAFYTRCRDHKASLKDWGALQEARRLPQSSQLVQSALNQPLENGALHPGECLAAGDREAAQAAETPEQQGPSLPADRPATPAAPPHQSWKKVEQTLISEGKRVSTCRGGGHGTNTALPAVQRLLRLRVEQARATQALPIPGWCRLETKTRGPRS